MPVLRNAERLRRESAGPAELAARLEASEPFLGLDYALLSTLAERGYGELTLLTDELGPEAAGFKAIEFGWRQARALYPVSARAEPEGAYLRWLSVGGALPLSLFGLGNDGALKEADASGWAISAEPDGFTLFLREAGPYLLRWDGGELAFWAPAPPGLSARGALSSRLAPLLAAPGAGESAAGRLSLRDGGGRSRPGSLSLARLGEEGLVMAPWRVMGQAVAAGFDARSDLAFGPAAFASAEAALALWTAWQSRAEAFVDLRASGAGAGGARVRLGESVVLLGPGPREGSPVRALLAPPPEEYWQPLPGAVIDAGARRDGRLPAALILALLYGLKLYLSKRLRS
jgi:hypothetical protein